MLGASNFEAGYEVHDFNSPSWGFTRWHHGVDCAGSWIIQVLPQTIEPKFQDKLDSTIERRDCVDGMRVESASERYIQAELSCLLRRLEKAVGHWSNHAADR